MGFGKYYMEKFNVIYFAYMLILFPQFVVGSMDFLANIVCLLSVKVLGKRVLCLLAVFASGVCCIVLSELSRSNYVFIK